MLQRLASPDPSTSGLSTSRKVVSPVSPRNDSIPTSVAPGLGHHECLQTAKPADVQQLDVRDLRTGEIDVLNMPEVVDPTISTNHDG